MKMPLVACRRGKLLLLHWAFSREREIGTFNSFVKTRGAGESPKQRQQNSYRRPFHWNLTYFLDFTDRGIAKYASFRYILHILSPGNNISFNRNNPSILKCRYGIFLFRSFRLTTGRFPLSFFFTRKKELRKSTRSDASLVNSHKFGSLDCLGGKIKGIS